MHGQLVSQLRSSVLDGRPLFWFCPEWVEALWIWGWSLVGGILVRFARHPLQQVLAEGGALGLLLGGSVVLFFGSGWVPVVVPTLGLIATGTGVLAYSAYQTQQERAYIAKQAQEQEKNISLLQALLREKTYNPSTGGPEATGTRSLDEQTAIAPAEADESTALWTEDQASNSSKSKKQQEDANLLAGRYQINRVLGSGGFGITYLAQDIHRPGAPQCVVKYLRPARRDEKFLQIARRLFRTEAEILEKLGKHPQIPQLLAYFEEKKEFYLVQEYVPGNSVSDELPVDKRVPEGQVIELLKGVLEILSFIHEHSVIHRDVKPSNIMRRESDGQVVLIDFGAVKQIQPQERPDHESFTVAIGTRGYAPPEQYAGHPSFSSDIYALGMIAIQALTGIPPYQLPLSPETGDVSWRHLANVQEEFANILDNMVRYHFAARYQSAAEVMEKLRRI